MTEKIELMKLAMQLTIAILDSKDGSRTSHQMAVGNTELPAPLAVFDATYQHLQDVFNA